MVYFVGAGPGAKDLITVRGMRLLEQADVIIYAGSLVNPELLSYAGSGAKIYDSAKMTLEEVLAVIREAEKKGLTTVRLHTGEPSLYGAVREQMDVLAAEGISYESCPGVSACFGSLTLMGYYNKYDKRITTEDYADYIPGTGQPDVASRYCNEDGVEVSGIDFSAQYRSDMGLGVKLDRSEERRVGKECRSRWSPYH